MEAPRIARLEDYSEAMAFTDMVFRPGQKGRLILQQQYPHAYRRTAQHVKRLLTVRHEGAITGCLATHPMVIRVGSARLRTGGIGIVGTHPQHRGQGIMTAMLRDAIRRMEHRRYALSILGGDRQRYGWFGWENGGTRNTFEVSTRIAGKPNAADRSLKLRRFQPTDRLCRRLRRLGARRHCWVERPLDDMARLFRRNGRETWVCERGRQLAYVVLGGAQRRSRPYERIDEAGGEASLVRAMVRVLMNRFGLDELTATAGPNADETAFYLPLSQSWQRSCDCMIKIVDLSELVAQLRPLLVGRARAAGVGGCFRLTMTDSGQEAEMNLGKGPRRKLTLPDRSFVHLFFGIQPLTEIVAGSSADTSSKALAALDALLPLPLYIPPVNHI